MFRFNRRMEFERSVVEEPSSHFMLKMQQCKCYMNKVKQNLLTNIGPFSLYFEQ